MGYNTDFYGSFEITPPLSPSQVNIFQSYSEERHGKEKHLNPEAQPPDIWCNWTVSDDGQFLLWNDEEKFQNYAEWLEFVIKKFFVYWKVTLNGSIEWRGEERNDIGRLIIKDNKLTVQKGKIVYGE